MWRLFVINLLLVGNERRLYYMCQAVPNGAGSAEAEAAIEFGQGNHSCCPGEKAKHVALHGRRPQACEYSKR